MADKFIALLNNETWTIVPPKPSMNIVSCRWVFRIKRKAYGSVDKNKAGLVAKGFHQQPVLDFGEIYNALIKPVAILTVLSLVGSYSWPIKQIDVSNVFLHGYLTETVYMAQPPGFVHLLHPQDVCLLKKSLYGLKQAPCA